MQHSSKKGQRGAIGGEKSPGKLPLYEKFDISFNLISNDQGIAEKCPYCGRENKFYVSVESGQYDCKVCRESGNAYTFIRWAYESYLDATTDDHLRDLKENRGGICIQTLKRHGYGI
jgi:hypothetical protein